MSERYILTLSCQDVCGIVAAVTGFLHEHGGFIIESAQFGDASTGRFFLRIEFSLEASRVNADQLQERFAQKVAAPFAMEWELHHKARHARVLIMVSQAGHCLNDLLYRVKSGLLPVEIPAVVSNHETLRAAVEWHGIPFYYLPMPQGGKAAQEAQLETLISEHRIELVALARYMQVLSPKLCHALQGRAINIHHSFLPSFKGAKPYRQAFDRGVKLIGATAHYVTDSLDEGPIIEQEVARVDHANDPETLQAIGRDIESLVLARALKYHAERRVLINGAKTVVFR